MTYYFQHFFHLIYFSSLVEYFPLFSNSLLYSYYLYLKFLMSLSSFISIHLSFLLILQWPQGFENFQRRSFWNYWKRLVQQSHCPKFFLVKSSSIYIPLPFHFACEHLKPAPIIYCLLLNSIHKLLCLNCSIYQIFRHILAQWSHGLL